MLGHNIRSRLVKKNMSASDLADILEISKTHLSYVMNEKRKPSLELLEKIAAALDTDVGFLLSKHTPPSPLKPEGNQTEHIKIPQDLKEILGDKTVLFDGKVMSEDDKRFIEQMLAKMYYRAKELSEKRT